MSRQRGGDVSHVDWENIKAEYLQGGISYRKLAEKHGISLGSLRYHAEKDEWLKQREEIEHKASTISAQKIVSQRAKDLELLDHSRSMLIQKLHHSIEKFPDIPGNRMEQTVSDLLPPKGDTIGQDGKRKATKVKTVKFESDLMKMVSALDKLMELTGYINTADDDADDGFLEALNAQAAEVTEDDADIPDDL